MDQKSHALFIPTLGSSFIYWLHLKWHPKRPSQFLHDKSQPLSRAWSSKDMGYGDHLHLEDFCTMWSTETGLNSLFFDVKLRFFTNLTHIKMMRWQGLNEIGAHQVVVNTSFHARSSLTLLPALQRRPCVYVSLWIGFIAISCALYILYTKHTGISRFYIWHRL